MEDKNLRGVHLPGYLATGLSEFSWTHLLHPSYRLSPITNTGPSPLKPGRNNKETRGQEPQASAPRELCAGPAQNMDLCFQSYVPGLSIPPCWNNPAQLHTLRQPSPIICSRIWFLPCSHLSLMTRVLAWHPSSPDEPLPMDPIPVPAFRVRLLPETLLHPPAGAFLPSSAWTHTMQDLLLGQALCPVDTAGSLLPPRE